MQKIYGNTEVVAALHSMVESGRIPHALMLHEDDGAGAFPIVLNFLEELYGGSPRVQKLIHPDIHFIFPVAGEKNPVSLQFIVPFRELLLANPYFKENQMYSAIGIEGKQGNISVGEARSILERLSISAVEGGYRTVVMYLPERMNGQGANALLKMIEEPPQKTLFVFITHAPEKVLTTVSSRCLHLRVMPLGPDVDAQVHAEEAEDNSVLMDLFQDIIQAILNRDLLSALQTADALADIKVREEQKSFCRLASEELRTIFLIQQKMPRLASVTADREAYLAKAASSLSVKFPRKAMECLNYALLLLERNVNQKIIFTNLVSQLYTYGVRQ